MGCQILRAITHIFVQKQTHILLLSCHILNKTLYWENFNVSSEIQLNRQNTSFPSVVVIDNNIFLKSPKIISGKSSMHVPCDLS